MYFFIDMAIYWALYFLFVRFSSQTFLKPVVQTYPYATSTSFELGVLFDSIEIWFSKKYVYIF